MRAEVEGGVVGLVPERSLISSTKVFHSPQEVHLPIHLADSKPQLWQKKADLTLAMRTS